MEELLVAIIVGFDVAVAMNSGRDIHDDQINLAVKLCEPHGGVSIIDGNVFQPNMVRSSVETTVYCRNGTKVMAKLGEVK